MQKLFFYGCKLEPPSLSSLSILSLLLKLTQMLWPSRSCIMLFYYIYWQQTTASLLPSGIKMDDLAWIIYIESVPCWTIVLSCFVVEDWMLCWRPASLWANQLLNTNCLSLAKFRPSLPKQVLSNNFNRL